MNKYGQLHDLQHILLQLCRQRIVIKAGHMLCNSLYIPHYYGDNYSEAEKNALDEIVNRLERKEKFNIKSILASHGLPSRVFYESDAYMELKRRELLKIRREPVFLRYVGG